jgi:hypothetical protein
MLLEMDPEVSRKIAQEKGDLLYGKILDTIQKVTNGNGDRLVSPNVVVSCSPRGLVVDVRMALIPGVPGMSWFVHEFNPDRFHLYCRKACEQVAVWWRLKHYAHSIEFTEDRWGRIKSPHR